MRFFILAVLIPQAMKNIYLTIFFISASILSQSQTIFFTQDFEGISSITNIRNGNGVDTFYETNLLTGTSQCGMAGKADAISHSSTNVNFDAIANTGDFVAINPESPCGGYYSALLDTEYIDLSTQSSQMVLSFRYLVTSTNSFGSSTLRVDVKENTSPVPLMSLSAELNIKDSWSYYETQLPLTANISTMHLNFYMEGGNGVAIDDIVVSDASVLSLSSNNSELKEIVYPNPVNGDWLYFTKNSIKEVSIFNMLGKRVVFKQNITDKLDISKLNRGMYLLRFETSTGSQTSKIIVH